MGTSINVIHEDDLNWIETSQSTAFRSRRKKLGGSAGACLLGASIYELPPGASAFPYHFHCANEELLYILAGEGTLRLAGTPKYLPQLGVLLVPDLAYDLKTNNDLINAYAWLRSDKLLALLREKAEVPVAPVLDRGKTFAHEEFPEAFAEEALAFLNKREAAPLDIETRRMRC